MFAVFGSHSDFREWFSNPITGMIEGSQSVNEDLINRLHGILRPFLLRRMKRDVEKQLPGKYEHVVPCSLSRRQKFLYDECILVLAFVFAGGVHFCDDKLHDGHMIFRDSTVILTVNCFSYSFGCI